MLTAQQQGGTERTSREVSRTADFAFVPALELRALIHNKSVSPVEVVTDTLARIEDLQPVLNPFVTKTRLAASESLIGSNCTGPTC